LVSNHDAAGAITHSLGCVIGAHGRYLVLATHLGVGWMGGQIEGKTYLFINLTKNSNILVSIISRYV